jgi:hypothetical protein
LVGVPEPATRQLTVRLRQTLAQAGSPRALAALVRRSRLRVSFVAASAGRLERVGRHLRPVAQATGVAEVPGRITATIRLTATARREMQDSGSRQIALRAAFAPSLHRAVAATERLTLP